MEQNIFLPEYSQIMWCLCQQKNALNIVVALLELNHENLMECQKKILKIWLNQTAIAPTSVDQYFLPDINFNGHCLIKNNISIPEKVISLYISYMLNPWLRNLNTDFTVKNYYLDL